LLWLLLVCDDFAVSCLTVCVVLLLVATQNHFIKLKIRLRFLSEKPFSKKETSMPVELTWDGKYDADGRRKSPLKIALPFQTVETVNESVQERQRNMFAAASQAEWRNRLIGVINAMFCPLCCRNLRER
jgi:hypothetical protein